MRAIRGARSASTASARPVGTGHRFTIGDPPDAAALVSSSVGVAPWAHHAVVRVMAPQADVAALVPGTVALVEPAGPDRSTLRTGSDDLGAILGHLVMLGHEFEVLEPPELRERALALGKRLVRSHRRG